MASLAESFLKDLEDEEDVSEAEEETAAHGDGAADGAAPCDVVNGEATLQSDAGVSTPFQRAPTEKDELPTILPKQEQTDEAPRGAENQDRSPSAAEADDGTTKADDDPSKNLIPGFVRGERLLSNSHFCAFVEELKTNMHQSPTDLTATVETMKRCNDTIQQVDSEILMLYRYVRETYGRRFPELESLVPVPLDYLFVVKKVQNNPLEASEVCLGEQLSNAAVLAVSVAASVSVGKALSPEALRGVLEACREVDELMVPRCIVLEYIENRMCVVCPNLSAIIGSSLAARLVAFAGGLYELSAMPSQNVMLLGGSSFSRSSSAITAHRSSAGNNTRVLHSSGNNYGVLFHSEIIQQTPPQYRVRALKVLAGKCALAVRKDVFDNDGSNTVGKHMRDHIASALKLIQAPPPARLKKPLPVPEEKPKPRRGGRRKRRLKEKWGMTEARKKANRLHVTIETGQAEEYDDDADD